MSNAFFRGYVPVKNKKCLMPYKDVADEDLLELSAAKKDDYAGVLSRDAVLVDVDDMVQAEKLLNIVEDFQADCRVYATDRGMHFLFKNEQGRIEKNATGAKLACGITADIKIGSRNAYSILKNKGVAREIVYDIFEEQGEKYQEIPFWLLPVRTKINLAGLEEGDGRNQALFNYILTLQGHEMQKDDICTTLEIANKYVLAEPLDEKELGVIMRADAFKKENFFRREQFLFDKFAKYLKSEHHITRINGQLHVYENGVYVSGYRKIESLMIKHLPNLSQAKRREVVSYLELLCGKSERASSANLICFRNGVYNLDTNELEKFSPNIIVTNKIDWNFIPDAKNKTVEGVFHKLACKDLHIYDLLCEVVGYTLYRRSELRKAFILTGEKGNGKSTFLSMITYLLGENNTAALDLNELGLRFKTSELFDKLANIGDDIGDEFVPDASVFKKLASGDRLNVEKKGQDPFDFSNYAKLIFSANSIPRIRDRTGAVLDRLVIVPFNAEFTADDKDFDPYIKYKLQDDSAMEYLIQLGIKGLHRVLTNKKFTICDQVQKQLEEYAKNNNPILFFFAEHEDDIFVNQSTSFAYSKYRTYCWENEYKTMSKNEFSKQIKRFYNFEIIDKRVRGEKCRIFVKK